MRLNTRYMSPEGADSSGLIEASEAAHLWAPEPTIEPGADEPEPQPPATPTPPAAAQSVAPQAPAQPTVPAAPALTPEAIAAAVRAAVPQQPNQPAPTQADYDRVFNRFVASEPVVAALLEGGPAAVQALQTVVEGAAKYAATLAQHYVDHHLGQVREQLTPLQELRAQQEMQQYENKFFETNPDLKDPKYRGLLEGEVSRLRASGARFESPEAAIAHVAKTVRAQLTALGITPTAAPAAPAAPARQPAPVSMGGQAGAAPEAPSGAKRVDPTAKALFG